MKEFATVFLLGVVFIFYCLPGIIADVGEVRHRRVIRLINLFLGWTILGWFGALIWAVGESPRMRRRRAMVHPRRKISTLTFRAGSWVKQRTAGKPFLPLRRYVEIVYRKSRDVVHPVRHVLVSSLAIYPRRRAAEMLAGMNQPERKEELGLAQAVTHMLEECRMVLPGLQALLGFQLIAVFNSAFSEKLTPTEQRLHLLALGLVAIAGALVMTPAAYHRQTRPLEVSDSFIRLASRLLLCAMAPLTLGIGLDFYIIARVILENHWLSALLAIVLVGLFSFLWFFLPRTAQLRRVVAGNSLERTN